MTITFTRQCAGPKCTNTITARRGDKNYCSNACKSAAWRAAQKDARTVRARAVRALCIAVDRLADVATQDDWDEVTDYLARTVRARKEGES